MYSLILGYQRQGTMDGAGSLQKSTSTKGDYSTENSSHFTAWVVQLAVSKQSFLCVTGCDTSVLATVEEAQALPPREWIWSSQPSGNFGRWRPLHVRGRQGDCYLLQLGVGWPCKKEPVKRYQYPWLHAPYLSIFFWDVFAAFLLSNA